MIKIAANINLGVIPVCNFSCGNGNCVADNLCQCFDGWTGDHCDEGIPDILVLIFILPVVLCNPVCANGYCVQTNSCVCDPGWTGDRCRIGESSKLICTCKIFF